MSQRVALIDRNRKVAGPGHRTKIQNFNEMLTPDSDAEDSRSLKLTTGSHLLGAPFGVESLRIIDPVRFSLIQPAFEWLDIPPRESISLSMPVIELGNQ